MNVHITFDTGVLIALERRKSAAWNLLRSAERREIRAVVPQPILIEWWRGRSDWREQILRAVRVEPLTDALAKLAGEALAKVAGATAIDAVVMATASVCGGGTVFTTDLHDLTRLQAYFPTVAVVSL